MVSERENEIRIKNWDFYFENRGKEMHVKTGHMRNFILRLEEREYMLKPG
jgi:hypothetical protein